MGDPERRDLTGHCAERLRAEQFSSLRRRTPGALLANICNALVFVASCWGTTSFRPALVWAAVVWSIVAFMYVRGRLRRSAQRRDGRSRFPIAECYALALGSAWASLPLLFFDEATAGRKLLIACLSSGMLAGGAFVLASLPRAAVAFTVPIALGSLIVLLRVGDSDHMLVAVVLAVYTAVLLRGAFAYAEELRTLVSTQIEAERKASSRLKNLEALGGMAAGLAHEISQPLGAAAAYLGAARRLLSLPADARPTPLAPALDSAAQQLEKSRQIIGHLRHLILNGEPDKELLRLHEVIKGAYEANRARAAMANVEVQLRLRAANDLVLADKVQIGQVLANLINNALDAMQSGAGSQLTISTETVGEKAIRIDVADTGTGISPAIKASLFQPFVTTKSNGMGVGLALSRSIVEAHDGAIWTEPNAERGAVLSFTLPLAEES